jgi:hypothetical protein
LDTACAIAVGHRCDGRAESDQQMTRSESGCSRNEQRYRVHFRGTDQGIWSP